ncbi:MAG: glutamate--tRNA ligase [Planctomycetota bacterium]|nr:glutamate--tRNA ligase [Planctomycetota bacterium]
MTPSAARLRIAPSPTGDPHVGTAYVALFNRTHARQSGGQFLLRIDDTDQTRYQAQSEDQIYRALRWLGLDWDEGPDKGGPHQPYRQSERLEIYQSKIEQLIEAGYAYRCFCSQERLTQLREQQKKQKGRLGYDGACRELDPAECQRRSADGEPHVVRLKVPNEGETCFTDQIRGEIVVENREIDDQVLVKTDGFPTYHLANVVDDIEFGITHVLRAEEWLISTPKHVLIYAALEQPLPLFFHVPLLRNADQSKISKRKNPVSLNWFREQGYLREALLNFLALMGWSAPNEEEVFDMSQFEQQFKIEDISTGAPIFDLVKLDWLNGMHIRRLDPDQLAARLKEEGFVPDGASTEQIARILPLVTERMVRLNEFTDRTSWYFADPEPPAREDLIAKKGSAELSVQALLGTSQAVAELKLFDKENIESCLDGVLEQNQWKKPMLYMPLRFALTSRRDSPDLIEVIEVLGADTVQSRLANAIAILGDSS